MPDISTIKELSNLGLGYLAFLALLYGGWKVYLLLKELSTNHLAHIQLSLDSIEKVLEKLVNKIDSIDLK